MSAECKRLSPDHVGPTCTCGGEACALENTDPAEYLRRFDALNRAYVRKTLGWEFDLWELEQQADRRMRGL